MRLHLLVPGLLSRLPEWRQSYGWAPQAPGLQAMLGAAARERGDGNGALDVAAELLGVSRAAAAFRRLAQALDDETPGWVCADPVHLRADVDSAILVEAEHLQLDETEAHALAGELERLFAEDGWRFEVADAAHWYALPPEGFALPRLPGVPEAAGTDVGALFRGAEQSAAWKRFYAEAQMVLAQSQVNRRREARGMSPVNALWFWGGGARAAERVPRVQFVQGHDAVLHGMALAAGLTPSPPAPDAALAARGDALVCLDELRPPAAYDDLEAWERALARLDADWFGPLAQALERRRLEEVVLYADDRRWHARRRRGLARWRRGPTLAGALGVDAP